MKIERISWDQETADHIFNHSVSPEEVEEVLFNSIDPPLIMRGKQGRYLAYGKTNGGRLQKDDNNYGKRYEQKGKTIL